MFYEFVFIGNTFLYLRIRSFATSTFYSVGLKLTQTQQTQAGQEKENLRYFTKSRARKASIINRLKSDSNFHIQEYLNKLHFVKSVSKASMARIRALISRNANSVGTCLIKAGIRFGMISY